MRGPPLVGGRGAGIYYEPGKTMDTDLMEAEEERPRSLLDKKGDEKQKAEEKPEPPRLQPIQRPWRATAVAIVGIFLLAVFYTFYFAREIFLPLTLAWILNMLLRPILNTLKKWRIPEAIGAGLLLIGILAAFAAGLILVSEPASSWLSKAPQAIEQAASRVRDVLRPAESLQKAASRVEHLRVTNAPEESAPQVEIKRPSLMNTVLSKTTRFIVLAGETLVLLYFLMASGDLLMLKAIQALPRFRDKKRAVEITNEMQQQVSRYLGAVTVVNLIEGTVVGAGLAIVGMPNPFLWGALATAVNYVPYLGAMFCVSCITVVALVTFQSFAHALLAPAVYMFVNISDNFISPFFIGKQMVLNPLVVFIAILFWGWIWGIVGVLLAVPITMAFKIFCDHFKALAPIGEMLAGESEPAKGHT